MRYVKNCSWKLCMRALALLAFGLLWLYCLFEWKVVECSRYTFDIKQLKAVLIDVLIKHVRLKPYPQIHRVPPRPGTALSTSRLCPPDVPWCLPCLPRSLPPCTGFLQHRIYMCTVQHRLYRTHCVQAFQFMILWHTDLNFCCFQIHRGLPIIQHIHVTRCLKEYTEL